MSIRNAGHDQSNNNALRDVCGITGIVTFGQVRTRFDSVALEVSSSAYCCQGIKREMKMAQ